MAKKHAPRFDGYRPASAASSRAKRKTPSRDTNPEMRLRRSLWARGLRYRVNVQGVTGRPDIVFKKQRVVVFCDGDFFHGKDWGSLRAKLERRSNPSYWISKIEYNRRRDVEVTKKLEAEGWRVLRYWESQINADVEAVADAVEAEVAGARV